MDAALYNNAVRLEKIGTERFREDISYILDFFDYDLIIYSPEESENFNVEHIKMEVSEPNTVSPVFSIVKKREERLFWKEKFFYQKFRTVASIRLPIKQSPYP